MNSRISTPLLGCTPVPLAHYLKALGILRLVSEQLPDAGAVGHWQGNAFILTSALTREALQEFFLCHYQPTPIIAPWNGGSGFYPKDNKEGIEPIRKTSAPRFARFKSAIEAAEACLRALGLSEKPDSPEVKEALLTLCRNRSTEETVDWFDSAFVLTADGAKYPPLLGTGGNDGRLEFTNNFMQRLVEIFALPEGPLAKISSELLQNALFGGAAPVLVKGAIGQFSPAAGGGFNSSTGFDAPASMNPWDYILMMEGAILFAGAAVKRLETAQMGQLVYPFCVKQAGVGYGSASLSDEENSRCEMWLPLWHQPAGLAELQALLSEGRAQVGGRSAKNGVDFARAVATLGVDRGIGAFQRYGFQVRNGLAYFATPLDRVIVERNQLASQLLGPIDEWLEKFRRAARSDAAPSSVQRAARNLESSIVAFCKSAEVTRVQELLLSLGECEAALAGSLKWAKEAFIPFLPLLAPEWLNAANTGTAEFRLAASLASTSAVFGNVVVPLRCHMEPVAYEVGRRKHWFKWTEMVDSNIVWREGDLAESLNSILARRIVLAAKSGCESYPDRARIPARLADIALFIEGRTDDALIIRLLKGLTLVDFFEEYSEYLKIGLPPEPRDPPALYALVKPCFSRAALGKPIPVVAAIHRRARSGDGAGASILASRRLRGSGLMPAIENVSAFPALASRTAAALLFCLTDTDLDTVARRILRTSEPEQKSIHATATL